MPALLAAALLLAGSAMPPALAVAPPASALSTNAAVPVTGRGVVVAGVSALDKLTATAPGALEPYIPQPITLRAARGEWECFQAVVTAGSAAVTATPNLGGWRAGAAATAALAIADAGAEAGARAGSKPAADALPGALPGAETQLFWENYVHIAKPSGNAELRPLWWPDALVPVALSPARRLEAGQSAVLWVAVHVPPGAAPGSYQGRLDFKIGDAAGSVQQLQLPFCLQVEPLTLPPIKLRGNVALYYGVLRDWYRRNGNQFDEVQWAAQKKRYYNFLLDYDLNAYDLPVNWQSDEADGYLRDSRVRSVRLPLLDSAEFAIALRRLRQTATMGKAYYYAIDEPGPSRYAEIAGTTRRLHSFDRRIAHCVTMAPGALPAGAVDIWCPNIGDAFGLGHLDLAALAQARRGGAQTWWYTMTVPRAPYPTWLVDDRVSSIRLYGWMMARWQISGFVYSMVHGWGPHPLDDITSFAGSNGDGTLLYPAELAGGSGPMPSIRLMLLRDAIEDATLLDALPPAERDGVAGRVVGELPDLRIDNETAWREGIYRDLLFAHLVAATARRAQLVKHSAAANSPAVLLPIAKGPDFPPALRSAAYLQQVSFTRDGAAVQQKLLLASGSASAAAPREDKGRDTPRLWLAHSGTQLRLALQLPATVPPAGSWCALELAPLDASERYRFVVTPGGKGIVERHTRQGHFRLEGAAWSFRQSDGAHWDIEMTIPLERYNLDSPLRLNVLWRTTAGTASTLVLRRAFADDGDVTRMPLLQLAEQPKTKVSSPDS